MPTDLTLIKSETEVGCKAACSGYMDSCFIATCSLHGPHSQMHCTSRNWVLALKKKGALSGKTTLRDGNSGGGN